jgi:putative ABC transport system permease protein
MKSLPDSLMGGWGGGGYNTYILCKPGADIQMLQNKVSDIAFANNKDWLGKNDYIKIALRPLASIHLQSNVLQELGHNGNGQYVYMFSAVAIFILLIACVNFMNLSTARSAGRAREVGVRKVLGSTHGHLVGRFLSESAVVTLISTVAAILIAWLVLPLFNQVSGKQIAFTLHTFTWLFPAALL